MNQPPEYPSSGQPPQQPHSEGPFSQPYPPSQPYPTYQQPQVPYPHMPRPDGPSPNYPPQRPPQTKLTPFWRIVVIACGVVFVACVVCSFFGSMTNQSSTTTKTAATTAPTQQATVAPTKAPPTPTPVPAAQYPPKTVTDLHGLAAQGNASAIHPFQSESAGAVGACPQPKRLVTVDPGVKDRQLAEDLLAYFYGQHLDSPCGAIVFVYHNKSEGGDIFTAGRIKFDVTDASGADNLDPNATNVQHKLTLDVGGLGEQEYVVTY